MAELPIGAANGWLTDASAEALDVATGESRRHRAGGGRGHAWPTARGSTRLPDQLRGKLDLVVTNPPYVALDDPHLDDEVAAWEPADALFAGTDGLDDIRTIVGGARDWLRPGGVLVIEIGSEQGVAVSALLVAAGLVNVEIRPDLASRDRIAIGWLRGRDQSNRAAS